MLRIWQTIALCGAFSGAWGIACSDSRSANYNGSVDNPVDPELNARLCTYPVVRPSALTWQSLPEYCLKAGYDWTYTDLATCYSVGLRNEPPWPRDLDIACATPNSCTQPLEVDLFNVMLSELDFSVETQTLSVVMTYGLRWTDSRLVGAMMTEPRRTWRPKLALDAALLDVTEMDSTLLLNQFDPTRQKVQNLQAIRYDDLLLPSASIFVRPGLCEDYEAAIQKRGRNLGCCLSDSDTRCGGLSSFTSHVSCETIDSCATETVGKIVADFRVSNLDYSKFPYDKHNIQLQLYLTSPYTSTDPDWWENWRPPPPKFVTADIQSGKPVCSGSMNFSLNTIQASGFNLKTSCQEVADTALTSLLKVGTPAAYRSIPTRNMDFGLGGVTLAVSLSRQSEYCERYSIFPMVLIGAMATLVSLFNSDVKAFVGTRVGFAFLSILTALAASNDITPVNASAQQLTVVDTLSAFTVLFAGFVALESLVAYGLWCAFKCTPKEVGKGWIVRCMDYVFAILAFVSYVWGVTLIIYTYKSEQGLWVAIIVGTVFMLAALGLCFVTVWRMRPDPPPPEEEDLKGHGSDEDEPKKKTWWKKAAHVVPQAWADLKVAPAKFSAARKPSKPGSDRGLMESDESRLQSSTSTGSFIRPRPSAASTFQSQSTHRPSTTSTLESRRPRPSPASRDPPEADITSDRWR